MEQKIFDAVYAEIRPLLSRLLIMMKNTFSNSCRQRLSMAL